MQLVERKAQMHDAKLEYIYTKKLGAEHKILHVERKLLYEIHPMFGKI